MLNAGCPRYKLKIILRLLDLKVYQLKIKDDNKIA